MTEKRFPASAKKLQEAKQQGDIPRAPLLTRSAAMLGGALGLWWQAPTIAAVFVQTPWLDWSTLWWTNTKQLAISLGWVFLLAALAAYLVGSLAGGFTFAAKLSGAKRGALSPDRGVVLSLLLSLASLLFLGWIALSRLRLLSWLPTQEGAWGGSVGLLFGFLLSSLVVLLSLGVGQAVSSWFFWNQRHRRSYQELSQDTKDEEGQAKQFFSSRLK